MLTGTHYVPDPGRLSLNMVGGTCRVGGQWYMLASLATGPHRPGEAAPVEFVLRPIAAEQHTIRALTVGSDGTPHLWAVEPFTETDMTPLFDGAYNRWPREQS